MQGVTSSNLVVSTNKKGTFVYQKFLFCLSIAKAMAYHHALACISSPQAYIINRRLHRFRNDDIQCSALMIYRNKLRMIYKAYALVYMPKCDVTNSSINKNLAEWVDKRLFFRTKCALRHDKHTFGAWSDALHREVPAGVSGTLNFTSCVSTILHSGIAATSLGEAKLH